MVLIDYRYYLDGPRAGTTDVFADNLRGTPDNISPSSSGGYWIGIAIVRYALMDLMADKLSFMRNIIAKVYNKNLFSLALVDKLIIYHSVCFCSLV